MERANNAILRHFLIRLFQSSHNHGASARVQTKKSLKRVGIFNFCIGWHGPSYTWKMPSFVKDHLKPKRHAVKSTDYLTLTSWWWDISSDHFVARIFHLDVLVLGMWHLWVAIGDVLGCYKDTSCSVVMFCSVLSVGKVCCAGFAYIVQCLIVWFENSPDG